MLNIKFKKPITSVFALNLSIPENVLAQELNSEMVLLNLDNETYYTLNNAACRIWQLITELGDVESVISPLLKVYAIDEATIRQDVALLIDELIKEGLLQKVS
ncbi:PqqD family protein [Nostoc sp. PCC 7107]|uniref:PqqD family protein n=1 Tax=Nostoc sp. PCC 7107 TaxID=317936 RepID=UPI00029EC503|nr:PqqD family protein [Nostoc sp. PCC 7107]AFY43927.1 hypothetical protein Nos7107_3347 [Nostoc sp. PCC 7107]